MLTVDRNWRLIEGIAVPFGVVAHPRMRLPLRFPQGSLAAAPIVKLLIEHDHSLAVGRAVFLEDTAQGVKAMLKAANGERGDRALELAATTHSHFSIGLNEQTARFRIVDGVDECVFGQIIEVSLTRNPVFS